MKKTLQHKSFFSGCDKNRAHRKPHFNLWIKSTLGLKVAKDRDFAIVKQFPNSSNSNIVLTLDFGGSLIGESGNLGKSFPLIVSSGVGERVAYYAYPPEYYVMDNNYYNLITRMYYGMLGRIRQIY